MWFSCPISCATVLFGSRGTMAEERNDPKQFYDFRAKRATAASDMSLEENEGYITLFAVLPIRPGMTQYYYNAIEHIANVYKYTVVAMILPVHGVAEEQEQEQDDNANGSSTTTASLSDNAAIMASILESRNDPAYGKSRAKSILLEEYDIGSKSKNEILEYMRTRPVIAGVLHHGEPEESMDRTLFMRMPNIFLVSHNGMFIERMISPTMETIERRIKVHELAMENEFML
eukprot:jgi/Psemu1/241747/estExt_Genewise1.C_2440050